jgi:hypothetical protein
MDSVQKGHRTQDPEAGAEPILSEYARDAARSPSTMMMRRLNLAFAILLMAAGSASLYGDVRGSVSGQVRDSAGVPQVGAQVELLRPNLYVIASVYTNAEGRFTIPAVLPGRYALRATGAWFLPSLRENVLVHTHTVVNLTLNTLYEVMQWLPPEPSAGGSQKDEWAWTLRSAANRPLLRWLENGPLIVVSDGSTAHPRLKARLMASGQQGAFGESGERISAAVEDTPSDSRELLARVDFAPDTDAGMESMLGFRQDLGFVGSVKSVAAIALRPVMTSADSEGLDEFAVSTWETIHLGDEFEGVVGSDQVLARLSGPSSDTVAAVLPFADMVWRNGNSSLRYRLATMAPAVHNSEGLGDTRATSWLPGVSAHNGDLAIEHGIHQELGWEQGTDQSGFTVLVFHDRIDNPVIEANGSFASGDSIASAALLDPISSLLHAAGPEFSSTGISAFFGHSLPGGNDLWLGYTDGRSLVMPAAPLPLPQSELLAQALASIHPRRAQMYALSLSGTLDGTKTRWRASYRWQPDDTVTAVAPFAEDAADPYFSLHLRQPIHLRVGGMEGLNVLLDLHNLLAEGYRPFLSSDGSVLIFAQQQRGIRAGLALDF